MSASEFVALEFPSWLRWGQRKGAFIDNAVLAAAYPDHRYWRKRDDGTFGLEGSAYRCGWCGEACEGRRTAWCRPSCAQNFRRVWSWGALAEYVIDRDGACRRCLSDRPGWNATRSMRRTAYVFPPGTFGGASERAFLAEWSELRAWWEVDHILPVVDGGTDNPANLRLLCHACHVAVGYEQRAARREKRQPSLELAS